MHSINLTELLQRLQELKQNPSEWMPLPRARIIQ